MIKTYIYNFYLNNYKKEGYLIKFIFIILLLYFNVYLFINFFVYSYYITFYIMSLDILLISKFIYIFSNNKKVKFFLKKNIILIHIILLHMPLSCILFFYRMNYSWMNWVILFILCFLLLIIAYLSKFIFLIVLFIINIFIIFLWIYIGNVKMKIILNKYKVLVSFFLSCVMFYLNNY
jgi:hypothetical protein